MGRLIDASVLQEEYKKRHDGKRLLLIDVAPAVDAVKVVRCRDCKFYYRMTAETGICKLACRHLGNDGFCSEGERKDGDHHETD